MSNDRTCFNCDHWKLVDADVDRYSCDLGEVRPWFACGKWHRIRTEQERKDSEQIKRVMQDNDELFKGLAKL